MIILRKKRIINLLAVVTVCLIICFFQTSSINSKTVPTVSLPVTNKVIVIDAGHRGS